MIWNLYGRKRKEPAVETWLLNFIPLKNISRNTVFTGLRFRSNGERFVGIEITRSQINAIRYRRDDETNAGVAIGAAVESNFRWSSNAFRTLEFLEYPSTECLAWLEANAIKQEDTT